MVKCLPWKHRDLGSNPQDPCKKRWCGCEHLIPSPGREKQEDLWDIQTAGLGKTVSPSSIKKDPHPAGQWQRQVDLSESETSPVCKASSTARTVTQRNPILKNHKRKKILTLKKLGGDMIEEINLWLPHTPV